MILLPSEFKPYIERFNSEDKSSEQEFSIPNSKAWDFLERNIPWFNCPDKQIEETYYYRWWSYRKHLEKTPDGWLVTEFLPKVGWSGIDNTISCAAGHHLYEGRWLRNPKYMEDYARFWALPEAQPRLYSFWFADAVRAVTLATGNRRLAWDLLPRLVENYQAWQKSNQDANGLFHQDDGRDGMEFSLGGSGYRPSVNSYMFGEAKAIAQMAQELGDAQLAKEFDQEAAKQKARVQSDLWNPDQRFFETRTRPGDSELGPSCGVREEIGFIPWYFNLPDPGFETAWKQLLDPQGFAAPFGPTTAERRAAGFMHPENHDCLWNGPSWPYATTQTLDALANLLDNYHQRVISTSDYFRMFEAYARSQEKDGRPWIAEDLDADSGKWIVDLPRSVCYNHSGFADLVITGLVGLRPRADNMVEINPLVPAGEWKWFCLDAVPYHGHSLTILWDEDGKRYGQGSGLTLYVDGRKAARSEHLQRLTARMSNSGPELPEPRSQIPSRRWEKYPEPVLGGNLGTCFDVCVLPDDRAYKMYFSWRPKASIALVESNDGIHWSEPKIVLGPAKTGWEDDINRPSVVKVGSRYLMWYTGQFSGHSSIGFATSGDGLNWKRFPKPVLAAEQPWEKQAVMCPTVLWDAAIRQFRMWYSGGEQYEPDAIGYATSPDGIQWTKHELPIFEADPANRWESFKVTACQVIPWEGWYLMFYIGFRDIDHAQIGLARSRDGITDWERLPDNPIVSPSVDGWDADACYKPFAICDPAEKRWMLWYNGRHGNVEQIGLAIRKGSDLEF